jgi:tripartite ATP-independent transporter DctM subunit
VGLYIAYIILVSTLRPGVAPSSEMIEPIGFFELLRSVLPPLMLMVAVLGSIFAGIASPTESAAFGVLGAMILSAMNRSLNFGMVRYAMLETVKLSGMIFMILIGATAFSLVFNELGGSDMVLAFFSEDVGDVWVFITFSMVAIFILGFFIDFIEISFIIVPILVPVMYAFGIDPVWFAVLIALNLQASFLTPPFGLALFFLKGAAQKSISTMQIYRGVLPFIGLQLLALFFLKGAAQKSISTMQIYRGVLPFIALQLLALALVILFPDLVFAFL